MTSSDGTNFSLYDTVAAAPGSTNTYTDTAPTYGQSNYYEVKSTAGAFGSDPSNVVSITPAVPPTASDDSFSVLHDQLLDVPANGVLANDTASPGDTLSVSGATGTPVSSLHGTVTLYSNGSFQYMPSAGYFGPDTFTYAAKDGTLISPAATVTINVTDQMPQAISGTGVTYNPDPTNPASAGAPIIATVNDYNGLHASDPDADSRTYRLVNADGSDLADAGRATPLGPFDTGHGVVSLDSSGTYTYTPAAGFVGTDRFYFVANDGVLDSNVASVTIDVQAGMPILAVPDRGATSTTFSTLYLGLHWGQNVDVSQFQVLTQPAHGTLTNNNGSLTYTANHDYAGLDKFTYGFGPDVPPSTALFDVNTNALTWGDINALSADSALGGLTYAVNRGDTLSVIYEAGLVGRVVHTQGGTLSANILTAPSSGTLTLGTNSSGIQDGSFTYTPGTATGWMYFTYDISSSDGSTSPPVTAAIDVTDTLPLASNNQNIWTYQGQAEHIDMRLPYVDTEHPLKTLKAIVVPGMGPKHGTLNDNGDGTFTYVPDTSTTPYYAGPDSFTYQVTDGVTQSAHGTSTQTDNVDSNYETVFIDVRPLPVSLSVGQFAPGDPSATVALDPTAQTTTPLHLNLPASLPAGTQVTLKLISQTPDDTSTIGSSGQAQDLVQVFDPNVTGLDRDGQPPDPSGQLVLGSSAVESAGNIHTWTVGSGTLPTELLVSGNTSGKVVFELDVTPGDNNGGADGGTKIFGGICLATAGTGPAAPNPLSSPLSPVQPARPIPPPAGPPSYTVFTVGFGATVPARFHVVRQDGTNTLFDGAQWEDLNLNHIATDSGDHNYPICYTRSGPYGKVFPTAGANIAITNAVPGATYRIEGEVALIDGVKASTFGPVAASLAKDPNVGYVLSGAATLNYPLPRRVGIYAFDIDWKVSMNGGPWVDAGQTMNNAYVTNDDPQTKWDYSAVAPGRTDPIANPFETVLKIGCEGAWGYPNGGRIRYPWGPDFGNFSLVDLIWNNEFLKHRPDGVLDAEGNHMTYWHDQAYKSSIANNAAAGGNPADFIPDLDIASGLIKSDDGQCGAWAGLMIDVLRAQGINAYEFGITPTNTTKYAGFLAKTDHGQGGNAEQKSFANHAVVELSASGGRSVYDPSYGSYFSSEQAWMDGSVDAFQQPGSLPDVPYVANSNTNGFTFANTGQ